jgi:hypothetical protein
MDIVRLTDSHALETMKAHVKRVLDNPKVRIFQILGALGIGKRTAIREVLQDRGIAPVQHDYTILKTGKPIADRIMAHPDSVHIWDDVFRSNVTYPEVLAVLQNIQDGTIPLNGTFLLVANDKEFPDANFPPFSGAHVQFENNTAFLQHLQARTTSSP